MSGPGGTSGADGFDVVPAALRGAAGTFASEADALHSATVSLQRHLSTLGAAPWGTDDVGARFGAAYGPAADAVGANLGALVMGLGRISGALGAVAARYEQADAFVIPAAPSDRRPADDRSGRSGAPRRWRTGAEVSPRRGGVTGRRP